MMMADDLEHSAFAEQREFRALPMEEQLLKIFLNTRETNGHVAKAFREIEAIKQEQKKVAETLERTEEAAQLARAVSEEAAEEARKVAESAEALEQVAADNLAVSKFIRKWGAWGTAAILAVAAFGDRINLWDAIWNGIRGK